MRVEGLALTVVGAGVAGLGAALALARRGAEVTVLEQAETLGEAGAGLQISPNGARVLQALGLGEPLTAAGTQAEAVQLLNGRTGKPVLRLDLARHGSDPGYRFVHRADLIGLMQDAALAAGVRLHPGARVTGVDVAGDRPRLSDAAGNDYHADLLVGADGLHSRVRAALNGTVAPFFTHQVAWRGVIPGDPADPPVAEVHMGPGRHLVTYPLRGGTLRNIVAVEERRRWVEEGWSMRGDAAEMQAAFAGFSARVQGWLAAAREVWLWGLFRHPVARRWHVGGHTVILGDAAHPMLPFLAQGANMALEDAWVLADSLSRHPTMEGALAGFQSTRAPRVARVVAAAQANARNYHLRAPWSSVAHAGLRAVGAIAPGAAVRRFDWLYAHDITA